MSFASALKEAFLPTLFARSCDILAFKCDPYLLKARVVALLKEYRRYFSALKLIAKIPQKRARYTIFLSYFAPRLVWFRIKRRIKLLFVAESSLDSANLLAMTENKDSVDSAKSGDLRG